MRIRRWISIIVRRILNYAGRDIVILQPGYHYVPDYYGRSAHKLVDIRRIQGFCDLADATINEGRSFLYYNRLYPIYQSIQNAKRQFGVNGAMNFAEVGVYRGGTSHFLAATAQSLNLTCATLHSFDTFEGHASQDIHEGVDNAKIHHAGLFGTTQFDEVTSYLHEFDNVSVYKGRFQDTCSQVADMQFHFVHLDVDIYEPTRFTLDFFDHRLIVGGTVIIDDYENVNCPGVKKAVDEFVQERTNYTSMYLLNGQCLLIKSTNGILDHNRTQNNYV